MPGDEGTELNEDFIDMLASLDEHEVDFIIVGAYALAVHGFPRATGDIDVLVRATTTNSERVFRALIAFGAPVESHGVGKDDFARTGNVYQVGLPPRRIDLLTSISGVSFDEAAGRGDHETRSHRGASHWPASHGAQQTGIGSPQRSR